MFFLNKDLQIRLISPSSDVSSTRYVYLRASTFAVYAAFLSTLGGVIVYLLNDHKADPIYWGGVAAQWINLFGFASSVKKAQDAGDKNQSSS